MRKIIGLVSFIAFAMILVSSTYAFSFNFFNARNPVIMECVSSPDLEAIVSDMDGYVVSHRINAFLNSSNYDTFNININNGYCYYPYHLSVDSNRVVNIESGLLDDADVAVDVNYHHLISAYRSFNDQNIFGLVVSLGKFDMPWSFKLDLLRFVRSYF